MKIIFLDIDGVLNDAPTILGTGNDLPTKAHLDCLKQIVDATGAKIVLSSSWRLYKSYRNDVKNALSEVGLNFIDFTEELEDRDKEIREWLNRHPEVESFVILDDEDVFATNLREQHVLTSFYEGLLSEHIPLAIEKLAIIKPEDTLISVKKEV